MPPLAQLNVIQIQIVSPHWERLILIKKNTAKLYGDALVSRSTAVFREAVKNPGILPDKSINDQYDEPSRHILSIGHHEKSTKNAFFSPLTMKSNVFCASKNQFQGEKVKLFTFAYSQAVTPPTHLRSA